MTDFSFFVGLDWGQFEHAVCLQDAEGSVLKAQTVSHDSAGIQELLAMLRDLPGAVAVGIEAKVPILCEALLGAGHGVFTINPKQLDRFRDRYTNVKKKDDTFDAFLLACCLRTDAPLFSPVSVDADELAFMRELNRADEDLERRFRQTANQLRELVLSISPDLLKLCPTADRPWFFDLLTAYCRGEGIVGEDVLDTILRSARLRKFTRADVRQALDTHVAINRGFWRGTLLRIEQHLVVARPLHQQRHQVLRLLEEAIKEQQPELAVLTSIPGVGPRTGALIIGEAGEHLLASDHEGIRRKSGIAPVTMASGKRHQVRMRRAKNDLLYKGLFHATRVATTRDPHFKARYQALRKRGHTHGRALRQLADKLMRIAVAMVKAGTPYDPARLAKI